MILQFSRMHSCSVLGLIRNYKYKRQSRILMRLNYISQKISHHETQTDPLVLSSSSDIHHRFRNPFNTTMPLFMPAKGQNS